MSQSSHTRALEAFQKRIDYQFSNPDLLVEALTHSSVATSDKSDNERLEFLGDRVLGLVIAENLVGLDPKLDEGSLARALNALVRKEACVKVAQAIGLSDLILLDEGEERSGGRNKKGVLGDACEALIAAIYLDGGLAAASAFITEAWAGQFEKAADVRPDAKTALQEWSHARHKATPQYEVIERTGPDHDPRFTVTASVAGGITAKGSGRSKREAESVAAETLLREQGVWS